MHTDTDAEITDLLAKRRALESRHLDAVALNEITEINLQILRLQGRQAHQPRTDATAEAVKSLLQDGRNADARRDAEQGSLWKLAGIEEQIVWTTKDGKRWDRLEDAIEHQRSEQIIMAIYNAHGPEDGVSDAVCDKAKFIGAHAAEIFAILEPFFRKGE
jgi:hypothetical protein